MPRPAAKRNRLTKAFKANPTKSQDKNQTIAKSPPAERAPSVEPRQTLTSQTPLRKNNEQAIESSPTGDRAGTASQPGTSRPPTRSRGYSATKPRVGNNGETNSRIPGTPGFDTSMLSNFRRRPRQQSILQMVQAEDESSELDDDEFLGGLSPQDESTPLNTSRGKSLLARKDRNSPTHSQSQSPSLSPSQSQSPPSSDGSRKRKRASNIEVQVPMSSAFEGNEAEDVDQVDDSPSATPVPRNTYPEESDETPLPPRFSDILSQTMLPPASSPATSQATAPRSPLVVPQPTKNTRKSKDSAYMSTAALQQKLLPRRRQRRRGQRPSGELDHSSDESDESDDGIHDAASGDEDELSVQHSRRSRSRADGDSNKPKPLGNSRDKPINNPKQRKAKGQKAPATKSKSKSQGRTTYSRSHEEVNKENEDRQFSSPSSSVSSPPQSDDESHPGKGTPRRFTSAELRAATIKFAEIDKWEMEFEEVSGSEV